MRLPALAMGQAKSDNGPDIKHALEHLDRHTASTVVTRYFRPSSPADHEAITSNTLIMGEIRNGKVAWVYTMRTAAGLRGPRWRRSEIEAPQNAEQAGYSVSLSRLAWFLT
ncbi:MAG TPA: hypothetical protein VF798_09185 [Burkholderiaceae bacterium]